MQELPSIEDLRLQALDDGHLPREESFLLLGAFLLACSYLAEDREELINLGKRNVMLTDQDAIREALMHMSYDVLIGKQQLGGPTPFD